MKVAHSLGAIVVREALTTAYNKQVSWLDKVVMMLFAPAHHGAHVKRLIFETLDLFLVTKLIGSFAKLKIKVLNDLDGESKIIRKIKEDSKTLIECGKGDFTKAKCVVHAKGDSIVTNLAFNSDEDAIRVGGSSHSKVCKPILPYNLPIDQLKELLNKI